MHIWHRWGKWGKPKEYGSFVESHYQERTCAVCNLVQRRSL